MDGVDWNPVNNDSFEIGTDDFSLLEINPTPDIKDFYYFFYKKEKRLIKKFILHKKERVDYLCTVILIKKGNKFSPRLAISIRDKQGKISEKNLEGVSTKIKARVSLEECYENFWKLIAFLQSLRDIEIPQGSFSLVSVEERDIVKAIKGRDVKSVIRIIKELSKIEGVTLSEKDIEQILDRKGKLSDFRTNIEEQADNESWWQDFFENNKWIFGYGLNYQILRDEQSQPHYGGESVDGKGGQKGDYLTTTQGDINFTVLVEIKTPNTDLLQGTTEIRNGAWSLSKELTDAVSQIQANVNTWETDGSTRPQNIRRFDKDNIFTVEPKGIIVIGTLSQLKTPNSRMETFQRFRQSIHGIDILTFDELLKRVEFIVAEDSQKEDVTETENEETKELLPDDIPF